MTFVKLKKQVANIYFHETA